VEALVGHCGWALPLLVYLPLFASIMSTVAEIVKEHRLAAAKQRKEFRGDPEKARAFLIRAGILTKDGKRLAKRYR
jgi:hypothetical protein